MASFTIQRIPQLPASDPRAHALCTRMRLLRLKSLQSDPGSFISRYESEASEPFEFFLNRFASPVAHHLTIVPRKDDLEDVLDQDWFGFCVIITPEEASEYQMAALWIDPSIRGHGWGKRMVQATTDFARAESAKAGKQSPYCSTSVRHGNESAAELYKSLGFRVVDEKQVEKEGRKYYAIEMRMDL